MRADAGSLSRCVALMDLSDSGASTAWKTFRSPLLTGMPPRFAGVLPQSPLLDAWMMTMMRMRTRTRTRMMMKVCATLAQQVALCLPLPPLPFKPLRWLCTNPLTIAGQAWMMAVGRLSWTCLCTLTTTLAEKHTYCPCAARIPRPLIEASIPFSYLGQGVSYGYIVMKGTLQGTYPAPSPPPAGSPTPDPGGQYTAITASELATHATANDCWGRVGSWVVDMTALRSTHAAGNSMLLCGQDVTASFRSIHADSYISRMPVMGTYDSTVHRNPASSTATTTTPGPTPPAPSPSGGETSILNPTVPTEDVSVISTSEMSWHAVLSDCWLAMRCKVYDMTSYIPFHTGDRYTPPGGQGAIEKLCGADATAAFEAIHPISYMDLSIRTGAVLLGDLAGCGAAPAAPQQTTTATTTTTTPAPAVPQNATMWYNLSFPNLLASSVDLTSAQTEASLAIQAEPRDLKRLSLTGFWSRRLSRLGSVLGPGATCVGGSGSGKRQGGGVQPAGRIHQGHRGVSDG